MPRVGEKAPDHVASREDLENFEDPWGGSLKEWRVENAVTKRVALETNSETRARRALRKYQGTVLVNQWAEKRAADLADS